MKRQRRWIPVVLLAVLAAAVPSVGFAQKRPPGAKQDEKRENEAVRKAQQDLKTAQDAANTAERAARRALDELRVAERGLVQATAHLQKVREDLETRHAETSGLVAARKQAEAARRAYDAAGQPILQKLAETAQYQQAVEAAKSAEERLKRLRAATEGDAEERSRQLAEAARVKMVPSQLERAALDAEPALKSDRARLTSAEDAVAAARKVADRAIDKDPALQSADDMVAKAKQQIASARRTAQQEERQLAEARQKVAREQQDLQQKIAADRRDDNKGSKPKNKKKN